MIGAACANAGVLKAHHRLRKRIAVKHEVAWVIGPTWLPNRLRVIVEPMYIEAVLIGIAARHNAIYEASCESFLSIPA